MAVSHFLCDPNHLVKALSVYMGFLLYAIKLRPDRAS